MICSSVNLLFLIVRLLVTGSHVNCGCLWGANHVRPHQPQDSAGSVAIGPQERTSLQSDGTPNCAPEPPLPPTCQLDKQAIADRHLLRPQCGNHVIPPPPTPTHSVIGEARICPTAHPTHV